MALASNKPTVGNTTLANKIRNDLAQFQSLRDELVYDLATCELAKENGEVGTVLQNLLGAPTLDDAVAAYAELDSLVGKINTDGSVSEVKAAINQAANKWR